MLMSSATTRSPRAISIEGPEALIDRLAELHVNGLEVSTPTPSQSPADVLDAPMGGRKILAILKIVTALLGTATAGVKLADEVEKFLHDNPAQKVIVSDPISGRQLAKLDGNSPKSEIDKIFRA